MTTKLGRAARQLLEALENRINGMCPSAFEQKAITAMREALDHSGDANEMVMDWSKVKPEAIKSDPMYQMGYAAAIAEPVKQEPVAKVTDVFPTRVEWLREVAVNSLLYAAPVSAKPCKECGAKQAQIDRLMLEYCPDEMTHEQMQEWERNIKPFVEPVKQEPVNKNAPFDNCKFHICDLPGQCIGEGKCHHPIKTIEPVKQESAHYVDSTPHLHVGDSSFEDWYQSHPKASGGDKQLARDAYAAGMGDPLVAAVEPVKQEPVAWQEAVSNVANNLGEMASQAHSQRFCDEINEQVDILFSLIVGGKYEQKN